MLRPTSSRPPSGMTRNALDSELWGRSLTLFLVPHMRLGFEVCLCVCLI